MDNAVYLGDIDPNISPLSVMDIRRVIMFQLLVWDKIIFSDSQFLTDPRLNILMGGYAGDEISQKYNILDVEDSYKGIEVLFQNGFIEVACRGNSGESSSLYQTWNNMKNDKKSVPYLPEDENYVRYLMSIAYNSHTYEASKMSSLFQKKLQQGLEVTLENGGVTLGTNDVEKELKRLFNEKNPLFRNILDFLRTQKNNGKITFERFIELYDYVYSCYNVNVSEILGCNINTKFAHVPFHIESGEELFGENPTAQQICKLRPTWALNPVFLDYLSFDEFVEIKKQLKTSKVRQFYLGKVKSPWGEIEEAWDEYTCNLELKIQNVLLKKEVSLGSNIMGGFGVDKFLARPQQETIIAPTIEIVKSLVSLVPGVGSVTGAIDSVRGLCGAVVALSKRNATVHKVEQYKAISELISKETRVVTKY